MAFPILWKWKSSYTVFFFILLLVLNTTTPCISYNNLNQRIHAILLALWILQKTTLLSGISFTSKTLVVHALKSLESEMREMRKEFLSEM